MKTKANNNLFNQNFWFLKSPDYFNSKYYLLILFIIAIYSLYTIVNIPLYIFYHLFGDLFENNNEINNNQLREEYTNNFRPNDISIYWIIFHNIFTISLIILSFITIKNQTYSYYSILLLFQFVYIFGFLMNSNITLIPSSSSFIYTIFIFMLIFCFILHIIYMISYYYKSKNKKEKIDNKETSGKYRINNRQISIDTIIDEIQLRMDMAKIKFNNILIKLKLHKIFRKIMFKPKDYYFMKKNKEKEKINEHIIRNIKGYKNNKNEDKKENKSQISDNNSTTFDSSVDNNYSKLNDDNESSPLNI
jgi:hypothetical protein